MLPYIQLQVRIFRRESNPYWLRWPSPDCIWRTAGTCSLLSGGTEIAVGVATNRKSNINCGPRPVKAEREPSQRDNTQTTKANSKTKQRKQTKHTKTKNKQKPTTKQHKRNKTENKTTTNSQQTTSRNAIPETLLGSRWDCMPDCNRL